jgi:hypothetical protein
MAALLLNQRQAAAHLGIGVRRFRHLCRKGQGPRVWNPDGGRPLYAVTVLDAWVAERDDRQRGAA